MFRNDVIFWGGEGGLAKRWFEMIRGRVGVWEPSKLDDVIYEQPLMGGGAVMENSINWIFFLNEAFPKFTEIFQVDDLLLALRLIQLKKYIILYIYSDATFVQLMTCIL